MLSALTQILLAFLAFFPLIASAFWTVGGILFRLLDEANEAAEPPGGWPGVSVLIPAFNEEAVIANCVRAALEVDYPALEVLVLDDGSSDGTAAAAEDAAQGDPRLEVIPDPVNRGKAERLNIGFRRASHELVLVCDADTHLHPQSVKFLVSRMLRSPVIAAVAGSPHVTNRGSLLANLQALEAASIIGQIRRTWALGGRVSVVAGVLGLFRREAVLSVGGYDERMATEDIDLTWSLLLAGWHTAFEPKALIGMEVPSTMRALWAQRCRWARGQGEVLRNHLRTVAHRRNRRLWPIAAEASITLAWAIALSLAVPVTLVNLLVGDTFSVASVALAWGVAGALIALIQLAFAVAVQHPSDRRGGFALVLGPLYPLGYWILSTAAAFRAESPALLRALPEERVAWDTERESADESAARGGQQSN